MPGATAAELVDSVLNAMAKAAAGDTEAGEELAGVAGKPGALAPAAAAPPEPEVEKITAAAKTFVRPNGEKYYVRKLGIHDDVPLLRVSRMENINILLYGDPGTGKTALIEAAFSDPTDPNAGFYTVQGTGDTEVADFIGGYVPISGTEFVWEDGPLLKAMSDGKPLYVDEAPLIDPKVMALIYGLMDGRDEIRVIQNPARGVVKAQPGFYVIAACNPNAPGARMSEALLSRFDLQFEVTTDYQLAKKLGVSVRVITAAQNLASKKKESEIGWAPQLRELLSFSKIEQKFGLALALRNMVSTAPENDRPVVADVLTRAFGEKITELKLG